MSKTKIEWCDEVWNCIVGCTKVSPGCTHCYAETVAGSGRLQRLPQYEGVVKDGHWTGKVNLVPSKLGDPFKWKSPKRVFVNSMSDLFHENVPFEYIAAVFGIMGACPQHTFQVLTKRPERMLGWFEWVRMEIARRNLGEVGSDYIPRLAGLMDGSLISEHVLTKFVRFHDIAQGFPNIWLGVSVEDQQRADERIPLLLQCPAAVRWISAEPLLGPIDFAGIPAIPGAMMRIDALRGLVEEELSDFNWHKLGSRIDWIVAGGESGPKARPANPDWFRSLRDQCVAAGVPFFFKQWGEWGPLAGLARNGRVVGAFPRAGGPFQEGAAFVCFGGTDMMRVGKRAAGRLLDGVEWNQYPETKPVAATAMIGGAK